MAPHPAIPLSASHSQFRIAEWEGTGRGLLGFPEFSLFVNSVLPLSFFFFFLFLPSRFRNPSFVFPFLFLKYVPVG